MIAVLDSRQRVVATFSATKLDDLKEFLTRQ